jgi:hypothetical protein
MTTKMKSFGVLTLFTMCMFLSCTKKSDQELCTNLQNVPITSNSPITLGQPIKFSVPQSPNYQVIWKGPNNYASQSVENTITDAQFKHEGWYYLQLISTTDNCRKNDSVFIDVKLVQETPPCTIANNTATYSNLATDNFSPVTKVGSSPSSEKSLNGTSGTLSSTSIKFNPYWNNLEPEDGVYYTTDGAFDPVDRSYNKLFVSAIKNSIYWVSSAGQKVYVSHVGSKLQVRYCSLTMNGNNGSSFTTIATGNLLEN